MIRKRSLFFCCLTVFLSTVVHSQEVTVGTPLQVPEGFELQLVAGPNLVERPIAVSRDDEGALYVTDSAGMSDRADKQLELKPHRIRKLVDVDGDGIYDTSTLFADGMMFPEGCMWYDGSLYVAAPPEIWKLTDTDGDGKCDEREVWFNGQTLTGCGNDLHGPYLGRDGWFYWCKGAFAEQTHTIHGKEFTTRSSHIFRSLPNGSRMEPVLTGGMDNPVNVAFLRNGDRFLSCTFFQRPENGQRDGLIHSVYGGVYGKKHDSIYEHQQTGDIMPVLVHMGAAAPCGLTATSGKTFGESQDAEKLFACYFNLHKVVEHSLTPNGSTYTTTEQDLVWSDHPDFHPTDVQEDVDGSLLIVDTGGWYKICCPTSQLAKPDVLGGIYRLRKKGQSGKTTLSAGRGWESLDDLVYNLLDPIQKRPAVQWRAVRELRKHGSAAVAALRKLEDFEEHSARPEARQRILWTLAGIDHSTARAAVRDLLTVETELENQKVALEVISLWQDQAARLKVLPFLSHKDPALRRLAAETIGRLGQSESVAPLADQLAQLPSLKETDADATGSPVDPVARIEEHALIYALIEINNPAAVRKLNVSTSPRLWRGMLVALDQMETKTLTPDDVLPALQDQDISVQRTASWVIGHHPEWGSQLIQYYEAQLAALKLGSQHSAQLAEQLAHLAESESIQALLAGQLSKTNAAAVGCALDAMAAAGLAKTPLAWPEACAELLGSGDESTQAKVLQTLSKWPREKTMLPALRDQLLQLAQNEQADVELRLGALDAVGPLDAVPPALFAWLRTTLADGQEHQHAAARIFSSVHLSLEQQQELVPLLASAGPFELPLLLPPMQGTNEQFGLTLVEVLKASEGKRGLRVDLLQQTLAKYPDAVKHAAIPLLEELNPSVADQTKQLETLLTQIKPGDARRGHEIFNSAQAKCITCHTRGYHGGRVGPDLTRIGSVRNTRDLLEAIIFPSASLVRGYEPVTIALNDGRVVSGIVHSEDSDSITLTLEPNKSQRIARSDIEEVLPSSVSLMPKGLDKILTPQDLSDLIAFLQQ
ncbi:MAG: c-type cytochrome [Planctomycetaceae bacterium]|nr:c-type cytochrome [Planctomycetaceae bacterium]MCB9952180.1 c-type cytochrome [Planctomycetaceae bacterium]